VDEGVCSQGLKPASLLALGGTAEAVPFPNQREPTFLRGLRRGKPRLYTSFSVACEGVPFAKTAQTKVFP
jgi:hypothetical protein